MTLAVPRKPVSDYRLFISKHQLPVRQQTEIQSKDALLRAYGGEALLSLEPSQRVALPTSRAVLPVSLRLAAAHVGRRRMAADLNAGLPKPFPRWWKQLPCVASLPTSAKYWAQLLWVGVSLVGGGAGFALAQSVGSQLGTCLRGGTAAGKWAAGIWWCCPYGFIPREMVFLGCATSHSKKKQMKSNEAHNYIMKNNKRRLPICTTSDQMTLL